MHGIKEVNVMFQPLTPGEISTNSDIGVWVNPNILGATAVSFPPAGN
jgi:hypothetical protein